MNFSDLLEKAFNFQDYGLLLPLVTNSLIAGAALGIVGGLIGIFIMMRDMAFAVHGIAELSFAGAAFALLIGADVVTGSVFGSMIAALILGILGTRARDRNSITGVLMPFGLGLGILFLSLYEGRSANKFGLLTGQIVAVDDVQLNGMLLLSAVVVIALLLVWRPLTFASVDPVVANARGVRTSGLSIVFMMILALAVAVTIQVVGALLVLALLITPAAAAMRVTSNPVTTVVLSIVFAELAVVGGILLALAGSLPISPYVTTISFLIYVICRGIEAVRSPRRHQV
ncbi:MULTISPECIES: metal ABC transporter permease [Glutamicibacter]|uniref:Zinc/manganese transport system permease protein n=2 Tax=Glutamicibacter TaxID=1742989 RepID=A0ABX4MVV4_9MICC|nr:MULTISPECIES: metal ABC transporter permease [Glutamicibacter]KWR73366.1 ABC transporter permease [Arthrobacter sp. W1]MBM7768090.1 zinc/manganese transport system permease protein [Glutamicibacter nicotianae]PJJ43465.1 zinc/manganese transport system permease protein [Glutamicibacter mysorens]QEP06852.1 metal ABC transporter permease [Glutamicibacter sp. ZJUTW]WIV45181.1 metal ABC transporter permease [Glutamicibacter nicotianae]